MSKQKKERNSLVTSLINVGISYRRIAKWFGVTQAVINIIDKKYNEERLKNRKCTLCGNTNNLVDDCHVTICTGCLIMIENIAKGK